MRSRTLRAGIVGAVTAASVLAVGSVAAAQPATQAKVVASAPYPGHGGATIATSPNGRTELVLTRAGLTKYDLGPQSVVRRGTTALKGIDAPDAALLIHRDSKIAYVVEEGARRAVVQVYDITGRAPRLVRTLGLASVIPDGGKRYFYDSALTPDGRRLLLLGPDFVQVLGLNTPARPTGGVQFASAHHGSNLAVTPDGTRLLIGYTSETEPRLARYSLPRNGAATLQASAPIVLPGWEGRQSRTRISKLIPARGSGLVFVEVWSYADEHGEGSVSSAIAIVLIGDLKVRTATVPDDAAPQLFLEGVTNDGARVFATSGHTTDEPELLPRAATWLGSAKLAVRHDLTGLGDVRAMSVSPAGETHGRLLVAAVRGGRHVLLEVDPW